MKSHQKIVDHQDEKVVGQDAQCRPNVKVEGLGAADVVVVLLEVVDERLPDEESRYDKEDVDAVGHRHVGETVEGRVEKDLLGMALHYAKNGKRPQKVQSEDALSVNFDAKEAVHSWLFY